MEQLSLQLAQRTVRDCLGRERGIERVWPDGSYSCPFCTYPVRAGDKGCQNPMCFARAEPLPPFPAERARELLAAEDARRSAEQERTDLLSWRAEYGQRRAAEERQRYADAIEAERNGGPCAECLRASGYRTSVRHRKTCPKKSSQVLK